ncbi:MAG: hypothetical protein Q9157_006351 [Trypethelium eluteriae]
MDGLGQPTNSQLYKSLTFKEKWDFLKPELKQLYLEEKEGKISLKEIMNIMKTNWGFDANESQYKYQFRVKWGWKKSISSSKKVRIVERGQQRAAGGKPTVVIYKGRQVDPKKLRRFIKEIFREVGPLVPVSHDRLKSPSRQLSTTHILPHDNTIIKSLLSAPADSFSPSAMTISTPSDVGIRTPQTYDPGTPNQDPPSPLTVDFKKKTAIDRASLFVRGDHAEFIKSMTKMERETTITWLHQFWLYAFKTAKHWGRGPRTWSADALGFARTQSPTPIQSPADSGLMGASSSQKTQFTPNWRPPDLCRWSIHVRFTNYEGVASPSPFEDTDPNDESTRTIWPEALRDLPYEDRLVQNLASNDFTNLQPDKLPIATRYVAQAAQCSPEQMLKESLGFAIMSGNEELVHELAEKTTQMKIDLSDMYPLHMAATYLHGAKTCCNILDDILELFPPEIRMHPDEHGHTVLDNLMQVVLRAHSNCSPGDVDDTLKEQQRFLGEEIDICGRWEADSDCYCNLLATGNSRVPLTWKHKFCHTSAQAITHCIRNLENRGLSLDQPSGLFSKYCSNCGKKLQLMPLHALICVAWLLATAGCEEEDLFGILACVLSLIANGGNPCETADISTGALFGQECSTACDHWEMRPSDFAETLATSFREELPKVTRIGWAILHYVLRRAEQENDLQPPWADYYKVSSRFTEDEKILIKGGELPLDEFEELSGYFRACSQDCTRPFGKDRYLGHLCAAVQTELLNYRRLNPGDPWISRHFNMEILLKDLENDSAITIGYLEQSMMRPYCVCGRFQLTDYKVTIREDCAKYYFTNLDDYHLT